MLRHSFARSTGYLKAFGRLSSTSTSSIPSGKEVLVSLDSQLRIATLTLNAPNRLNALTSTMGDELETITKSLQENPDRVAAVIVRGEGRAFSAGGDLSFLRRRAEDEGWRNANIMRGFYEKFLSLRRLPVPVIASVHGAAIGAGLCFALGCDFRITSSKAKLGVTFTKLGLHPGMGATYFLPRLVGDQRAAELLLTGEVIDGRRAADIGLVLAAVEPRNDEDESNTVYASAVELAKRIASSGPVAVQSCVRTLRNGADAGLNQALWREADAQSYCYSSNDIQEGITAVAKKDKPAFGDFWQLSDTTS